MDLLVVLEGFEPDPLARALAEAAGDKAAFADAAMRTAPLRRAIALHEARDPSDEAERAAACVLRHLAAGRAPVALAAIDRVLTRRIGAHAGRARPGASATRPAGSCPPPARPRMSWRALRACAWNAASDAVLDWLKNAPAVAPATASALERRVRRGGLREWRSVPSLRADAGATWLPCSGRPMRWREPLQRTRPLPQWLRPCASCCRPAATGRACRPMPPARRCSTRCACTRTRRQQWQQLPQAARRFTLADFTSWANEALEAASFVPAHAGAEQVVILPFNQLLGRAVAALVLPGCDEVRLPPSPEPPGPWTAAQRAALGLPRAKRWSSDRRAGWRSALQTPQCDVLWRPSDDSGEPLLASALVQALQLDGPAPRGAGPARAARGRAQPVPRPAAARAARCRCAQLSASAYEDLRRCPYRFFALRQLGLQEADEIDTEVDKRDFGNWLHEVLRHLPRSAASRAVTPAAARAQLLDDRRARRDAPQGLDEGEFLPFAAAWPQVRDGYLAWLARARGAGRACSSSAESEHEMPLGAVTLVGRIDRIDRLADGQRDGDGLQDRGACATTPTASRPPGEDTQLAFYAALLHDDTLRAAYVNVGERGKTEPCEQPDVVQARDLLVDGILHDLRAHRRRRARCPRWARATPASSAPRAACAARISGLSA